MELRHLRYFLAVADELHFGRAAVRLGMAQPPLSQQIKRLEDELGVVLFSRTKRSVTLTAAGTAMRQLGLGVLAQMERTVHATQNAHRGDAGRLEVGFVGSAAYTPIAAAIGNYMRRYPNVELILSEERTPRQIESLLTGRIDIGIVRSDDLQNERLVSKIVYKERFVLALPRAHPQARNNAVSLKLFKNEGFVLYPQDNGPGLYRDVVRLCHDAGFSPRHAQQASQIPTILAFVAAGLGVALLPASVRSIRWPGVTLRPLSDVETFSVVALSWNRENTSAVTEKFIGVILSEMNRKVITT